ncbi:MAG: GntR family transcriptional regulator [Angelakisella sp.]
MIELDYRSRTPIYRQLEESIMELIMLGIYAKDMQLPSVRTLAVELGINPNTIQKAYQELELMGVIYSVTGKGSFVQGVSPAQEHMRVKSLSKLAAALRDAHLAGISHDDVLVAVDKEYSDKQREKEVTDR